MRTRTCRIWVLPALLAIAGLIGANLASAAEPVAQRQAGVILWNKLGSGWEVRNSAVGPGGVVNGGTFVAGKFGDAFKARYFEDYRASFPGVVVNAPEGTIELWAKIRGFPETIPGSGGGQPVFVRVWDGTSQRYKLFLTANDGVGGAGLSGYADRSETATGPWTSVSTYAEAIGPRTSAWHHYALVWNVLGIPGVDDGTRQVALFLDGTLASGYWGPFTSTFPALSGARLYLGAVDQVAQGAVVLDNLIVWDCAITDFAGRGTGRPPLRSCVG